MIFIFIFYNINILSEDVALRFKLATIYYGLRVVATPRECRSVVIPRRVRF